MRIGLFAVDGWEGGRLYAENLARSLLALDERERPDVFWITGATRPVHDEIASGARIIRVQSGTSVGRREAAARSLRLRGVLNVHRLDFVYPTALRLRGWPAAATWIPDFQHQLMPEMFSEADRAARDAEFALLSARAELVVLSSEGAARYFKQAFATHAHKARVLRFATPLGPRDLEAAGEGATLLGSLPARYAYVANQAWRHKDHPTVIRAVARLADRGLRIPVVCSGAREDPRHPEWQAHIDTLVRELGVADLIRFVGLVPRRVQLQLFLRASVVVQPSLFEGWSTVVEDARALGRPVLMSAIETHAEQAPAGGTYFEPGDPGSLADALARIWENDSPAPSSDALRQAARERARAVARNLLEIAETARELRWPSRLWRR